MIILISTNYVTRAVCELIADKISGGYSLNVDNQEIPLYLNKDKITKYPQIRISPFIEKGDSDYQKYIDSKYKMYRHWQYGVFQVDIYSKKLTQAQNIYDVITQRLFDFFNLETVVYNWNPYFEPIEHNTYKNKTFALLDDDLFKDIYGIKVENTILEKVQQKEDLIMDSFFPSNDYLYIKTDKNLKTIEIKVLMQGRLFSNGYSFSDNGIHAYSLSKQRNLSNLEENEVERISFDLSILFSKKINRETLPIVNKVTLNKPNMR